MYTYVVTYDLNKPGQNYELREHLKENYNWAMLSESSYAIETTKTCSEVFNDLENFIDKNDTLYVVTLKKSFYGQGADEVNKWLEKHLKFC